MVVVVDRKEIIKEEMRFDLIQTVYMCVCISDNMLVFALFSKSTSGKHPQRA